MASLSAEAEDLRTSVIPALQCSLSNIKTGITKFKTGIAQVQLERQTTAHKKITEILQKLDSEEQKLKEIQNSELKAANALQKEIESHLESAGSVLNSMDKIPSASSYTEREIRQKIENLKLFQNAMGSQVNISWSQEKESSIKDQLLLHKKPFLQAQVSVTPIINVPRTPIVGNVVSLRKFEISSSTNMDITLGEDNSIWISMNKFQVTQLNDKGEIAAQFFTRKVHDWLEINEMQGIAATREGHLLTTDKSLKVVSQFLPKQKQSRDFIHCGNWSPTGGICRSQDDTIFVTLANDKGGKITQYTISGKPITQIEKNCTGKSMFLYPWYLTVNKSGNICVSDKTKKCVSVVNLTGVMHASYCPQKDSFVPYGIASDKFNHILVADCDNSKIHILSEVCELQLLVQCKDFGLSKPRSLCVDSVGHLWVGSGEKGTLQVLQYIQ